MKLWEALTLATTMPLCRRAWLKDSREGKAGCLLTNAAIATGLDLAGVHPKEVGGKVLGHLRREFPHAPTLVGIARTFDRGETTDSIIARVRSIEEAAEAKDAPESREVVNA